VTFRDSLSGIAIRLIPHRDSRDKPHTASQQQQQHAWGWSASHHSLESLEATRHDHELPGDSERIHLHLDRAMMGLGGYDSWSPNVSPEFLIETGRVWEFSVTLATVQ
jgi:hypothetical protein